MNEDKARELYEAHKWWDPSLQTMAQRIVANWPHTQARTDTVRALIRLDHETQVIELEARRTDWQRQRDDAATRVADIDAKLTALRGES